jgi:hypothetical protein
LASELAGLSAPDRMAAIAERQRAFQARLAHAPTVSGAFAEDGLAAWCEAAGLPPAQALERFADLADDAELGRKMLSFRKLPPAARGPEAADAGTVQLSVLSSDDHCPHLRPYPAAWPIPGDRPERLQWLAVSTGGGFSDLKIVLDVENADAVRIHKVALVARHFYNGQVTPAAHIAVFEQTAPSDPTASSLEIVASPFAVPTLDPQTRKQLLLILVVECAAASNRPFTLRPSLVTQHPTSDALHLPPARLQPRTPTWVPSVAGKGGASRQADATLRLNEPSVLSMVAVLDDDGAAVRATIRAWAEEWLDLLGVPADTRLTIQTQKHMSEVSFKVAKASKTLALSAARSDKLWPKLFDPTADYHSVLMGIVPHGSMQPLAGITVQAALRDGLRDAVAQAAHVRDTIANHIPQAAGGASASQPREGMTIALAMWMLNDPAVFERLGLTPEPAIAAFEARIATAAPVQGWITQAMWFPEFDLYDEYRQTLYEQASALDWFRSGLNGLLATRAWSDRRVRFVAPVMWLCPELMAPLDAMALANVADVGRTGPTTRIALRPAAGLADLERALQPILPSRVGD